MTEQSPPSWLQTGAYTAEMDRNLISSVYGESEGIVAPGDLAVTQRAAGANMSVDVAGGKAVVKGDLATYEGSYFCHNRGVTNLVLAASDATNPRIDRVVAEVLNQEYTGVDNLWRLRVITGTPAASPVAPAQPSNAISLATVAVGTAVSSITNANITDLRTRNWLHTGVIVCTSTTRPAVPTEGMMIYETNTDKVLVYNGTIWIPPGPLGQLALVTRTTDTASFGALTYFDSVTAVNVLPNRNLLVEIHTNVYAFTAGITVSISVCASSGTILNQSYDYFQTASVAQQMVCPYRTTSGAGGSLTYKIGAFTSAGTAKLQAAATAMTYITITDMGPT